MQTMYCARWAENLCLPSDEWAAWVQAAGSLLALVIAFGVPISFHLIERRERKRQERTLAHLAGTSVLLALDQMQGALANLNSEIQSYQANMERGAVHKIDHALFFNTLQSVAQPDRADMVALHAVSSEAAIALASGIAQYNQVRAALQTLYMQGNDHNLSALVAALSSTTTSAENKLSFASTGLKAFIESIEGSSLSRFPCDSLGQPSLQQ